MRWCALDIQSSPTERDAVAAWLVRRTGQAVQEREDGVLVGFAVTESAASVVTELRERFRDVAATRRALGDEDWTKTWRKGLAPRRIGRMVVSPSWITPEDHDGPLLVIDPETAFGTGEHGSTRSALLLLDRHLRPGDRVLDLGSGSGILAIAAAKLGALWSVGIDLDPEAEPVARDNSQRNGVHTSTTFLTGDARSLAALLGPADLIVSNILRSENERLLPVVREGITLDGTAIFAGMEDAEAREFGNVLRVNGFILVDETHDEGWWGVAARRG